MNRNTEAKQQDILEEFQLHTLKEKQGILIIGKMRQKQISLHSTQNGK